MTWYPIGNPVRRVWHWLTWHPKTDRAGNKTTGAVVPMRGPAGLRRQTVKKKFSRQFLLATLEYDADSDEHGEIIDDVITGTRRWSEDHRLVFRDHGQLWAVRYSVGLTEMQDESPWEHEGDEIECTCVHAVEVKTIEYQAAPTGQTEAAS